MNSYRILYWYRVLVVHLCDQRAANTFRCVEMCRSMCVPIAVLANHYKTACYEHFIENLPMQEDRKGHLIYLLPTCKDN